MGGLSHAAAGGACPDVCRQENAASTQLPVSVIIATKDEARNLPRCLDSLRGVSEIYVVDSHSADGTCEIAESFGAEVVQFRYSGGWPKKRQWALDTLPIANEWVLLLDADESFTPQLFSEVQAAIRDPEIDGYYLALDMVFLGKRLRRSASSFYKLALFRRGKGRFECRTKDQDISTCDMEVHEHVIVDGRTRLLESHLLHHNVENLDRYIHKHNQYSNWEARIWSQPNNSEDEIDPALFGTQAQRRRWLRKQFFGLPGSPAFFFFYKYFLRFGFLDGIPGLIYCAFQGIQFFHIKAKIYEMKHAPTATQVSENFSTPELTHVRH